MNWREMQMQWEQLMPLLLSYWPKLIHEDLAATAGSREALARLLRITYGYSATEVEEAVASFERDVRFPGAVK